MIYQYEGVLLNGAGGAGSNSARVLHKLMFAACNVGRYTCPKHQNDGQIGSLILVAPLNIAYRW